MDSPRTAASPPSATTTTVTYVIDTAGNLRSVTGGEHSVSYVYGDGNWADKLTGITVDNVSRTISYADAANPSNWFNGTDYTNLTWTQGRRLSELTKGADTYSYEYDMSCVRTVKLADGLRHEYVTQNGRVVRETVTNASTGAFQYILDFTYDESGHPLTMRRYVNAAQTSYYTYHYVLNAQGDVVKLLYGSNTTVAEYSYDAWGNILSSSGTVAALNPLRYRGYYFDQESGFYYLQSRYYDPIVKRFLNADSYGSTGQGFLGFNMFAYCNNNTCGYDPSGTAAIPFGGYSVVQDGAYIDDDNDDVVYQSLINGQGREPYSSLPFGTSNVHQSGCAVIAIHNTLILTGHKSDLRDWLVYFMSKNIIRNIGVMPWEIPKALKHAGVSFTCSPDPAILENCKNGGVVIMTY